MKSMKKIVYTTLAISLFLASTQINTFFSFEDIKNRVSNCWTTINDNRKPIFAIAALYTAYKTYTYIAKKYRAHVRAIALEESTKQYLTDAKIAEIARLTEGQSNGDLQGIINKIKTYASITEDGCVTPEIIDLAVKEYMDKLNAFKKAHNKKK